MGREGKGRGRRVEREGRVREGREEGEGECVGCGVGGEREVG